MVQYEQQQEVGTTTERQWIRASGLAAMVGGAIFSVWTGIASLYPAAVDSPASTIYLLHYLGLIVLAGLLLVGAAGLHARFAARYSRVGMAGVAITSLAFMAMLAGAVVQLVVPSAGMQGLPFVGILFTLIGMPLIGAALWRTAQIPRVEAALFVSVLPAFGAMFAIGPIVIDMVGIDLAWLVFSVPFGIAWILAGRHLQAHWTGVSSATMD